MASEHGNPATQLVAIGMGEGGLAALATFLRAFPPRSSMAVVVVGPNGTANEVARVQSETALKVEVAVDRGELLADHVYLVPDAREVDAKDGCLVLRAGDGHPGRIDRFFRGMLVAFSKQVVALVLSGEGDDGAAGIKRVKEDGGLTLAQEPDEATHDAMPRGALATGLVDLVLPVAELPARIVDAWRAAAEHVPGEAVPDVSADALRELLALLKVRTGHDFSNYKSATLLRRIARRMLICRSDSAYAYVRHVRDEPSELAALLRDFLISVTNFFRDPLAYEQVALRVIGPLFRDRRDRAPTEPVRLWVAGCATGEEAYSLAILCAEQFALFDEPPPVQIFATDIDAHALSLARIGSFSSTIASDVAPARLERFFSRQGTAHYRVRKEIREMVLFSPHNLLRDPPFSRLDIASCRNVLIYFNRQAQDRVLGLLHFGLRPDGHLFLGSAESAESAPSLFQPTDARHRLYTRRATSISHAVPALAALVGQPSTTFETVSAPMPRALSLGEVHHRIVEHYAPPSILVDAEMDVVHLSEEAGRYLTVAGGEPSRSLLRLVRPELRLDVRAAVHGARHKGAALEPRIVRFKRDGEPIAVTVTARAVDVPGLSPGMTLVMFAEGPEATAPPSSLPPGEVGALGPVVRDLEDVLERTRSQLQLTVEQYETSAEELRASNEELSAINEELRSTSEELETGKEELQSINEELTTLNHELNDKIDELSHANGDLSNLMSATEIGVIFLDARLRVSRFTPRVQDIVHLIPSDVGRPFAHVTHELLTDELLPLAAAVLANAEPVERELRAKDGTCYLTRIHPYRALGGQAEGVVLTFLDVTRSKRAEEALRERDTLMQLGEKTAQLGFWVLAGDTGTVELSTECRRLHGVSAETASLSMVAWLALVHPDDRLRVEAAVSASVEDGTDLDVEHRLLHPTDGLRWLWETGKTLTSSDGVRRVTGLTVDVTERESASRALRAAEERFHLALRTAGVVLLMTDTALRYTSAHYAVGTLEAVGKTDDELFPPEEARAFRALKQRVLDTKLSASAELGLTLGQTTRTYDINAEPVFENGALVGVKCAALDVSRSKRAELVLRGADRRKDEFLATLAHELRNPLAPLRTALDIQLLADGDLPRMRLARDKMDGQLTQVIQLVDDLMDVARITQGHIQLRRSRVFLADIVEAALDATRGLLTQQRHEVTIDLPKAPLALFVDFTRLTQVVTNLLQNAAKYTAPEGHISIMATGSSDGAQVELRVSDTGSGMTPELLAHVFDMFAQADDTLDRAHGGMGIGLSLVKKLVELHGGTVEAQSEGKGRGSQLIVRLPCSAPPEISEPAPETPKLPPRRYRVLVVDDNPGITELMTELLVLLGHEAHAASDGVAALAIAATLQPDVIFLDIGLPDMDGHEIARRLRATETTPGRNHPLIVAVSGWGQAEDIARSRAAGCDHHFVKPLAMATLEAIVGRVTPRPASG